MAAHNNDDVSVATLMKQLESFRIHEHGVRVDGSDEGVLGSGAFGKVRRATVVNTQHNTRRQTAPPQKFPNDSEK